MVALTEGQLNRATLARQMLLRRENLDPVTAVSRLCALQAQSAASPYLALWTRLAGFDAADLDRAFDARSVLKTTLMRTTLHAVAARDHPDFWAAHAGHLRRRRPGPPLVSELGVTEDQLTDAVDAALAHAHEPRTSTELTAYLRETLGPVADPGWWWAVRPFTRVIREPDATPWRFGPRVTYRTAVTPEPGHGPQDSLQHLITSYLSAFGPATVKDVTRFNRLPISTVRSLIETQAGLVTNDGPGGHPFYDVPGAPLPAAETEAPPRFLPMWDSVLLAYDDRRRVMADEHRALVVRQNGDFLPTVLVDGHVAGLWLPGPGGIEVRPFTEFDDATWVALESEAAALQRFLAGREPNVYGRYRHWWAHLPPLPTRTLGPG